MEIAKEIFKKLLRTFLAVLQFLPPKPSELTLEEFWRLESKKVIKKQEYITREFYEE